MREFLHNHGITTIIVIQFLQAIFLAYFVAKKVEKFKNELRKNEIKFSKYNELQIEALKSIYSELVKFHNVNYKMFNPKEFCHNKYYNNVNMWQNEFNAFMLKLHHEKILLTEDIRKKVQLFEERFNIIFNALDNEKNNLASLQEEFGPNYVQIIYKIEENEKYEIQKRLEKIKQISEVKTSEQNLYDLKKQFEDFFDSIIKK